MMLLHLLKPFVYLWATLTLIDDASVVVKVARLAFPRLDRHPDALCDLCDDVMESLLRGSEGLEAVPCSWLCLGRPRCTSMCETIQELNAKSGEFPCIAAGYCTAEDDDGALVTDVTCKKGPLFSCEPKKFCRKRRPKFGAKYTCDLKPGMGRWISLKDTASHHAKAMAAGLLHQKRCHEPGAGPYCVAGAHGAGRAAEVLTWFLSVLYGGYASVLAIESPGGDDDQQWLTFWVMFVAAMSLEHAFARVLLSRFPLYHQAKLLFTVWLVFYDGAATVYRRLRMRVSQWSPALAGRLEKRSQSVARGQLNSMISLGGTLITDQIALFERQLRRNPRRRMSAVFSMRVCSWEYDYTETSGQETSRTALVAEERLHQISKWLVSMEGVQKMEKSLDSNTIGLLLERAASVVSFQPKFLNVHLLQATPGAEGRLPVMDPDGKADCYVKFTLVSNEAPVDSDRIAGNLSVLEQNGSHANGTGRTTLGYCNRSVTSRIAYCTLEPEWNQKLEIPIHGKLREDGTYCNQDVKIEDTVLVVEAWDADCGTWGIAREVCRCTSGALACAFVAAYVLGAVDFLFDGTATAAQRRWRAALLAAALGLAAGYGLAWTMSVVLNADDEFIGDATVPLAVVTNRGGHALKLNLRKGEAARGGLRVKLRLSEN